MSYLSKQERRSWGDISVTKCLFTKAQGPEIEALGPNSSTHLQSQDSGIREHRVPRAHWPAELVELINSGCSEKPCLKMWGVIEEDSEFISIGICTQCPYTCRYSVHTWACTHTYITREIKPKASYMTGILSTTDLYPNQSLLCFHMPLKCGMGRASWNSSYLPSSRTGNQEILEQKGLAHWLHLPMW